MLDISLQVIQIILPQAYISPFNSVEDILWQDLESILDPNPLLGRRLWQVSPWALWSVSYSPLPMYSAPRVSAASLASVWLTSRRQPTSTRSSFVPTTITEGASGPANCLQMSSWGHVNNAGEMFVTLRCQGPNLASATQASTMAQLGRDSREKATTTPMLLR